MPKTFSGAIKNFPDTILTKAVQEIKIENDTEVAAPDIRHYTPPTILAPIKTDNKRKRYIRKIINFSELQPKINIGKQYQVAVDELMVVDSNDDVSGNYKEPETCLWNPNDVEQKDLDSFLQCIGSSVCANINEEIALTLLNNDPKCPHKALLNIITNGNKYMKSICGDWSEHEIITFLINIVKVGKDFSKISKMLEKKTLKSCVQFYYLTKRLDTFRDIIQTIK